MTDESDTLRYDLWIEEALRGVIRRSLRTAASTGLPGDHHFYITFLTEQPGVRMGDWLRAEYPDEMTIVLQHQYEKLLVEEEQFSVTLRFSGRPEHLVVPFDAVTSFADPSVSFGLQLKTAEFGDLDEGDEEAEELMPEDIGLSPPKQKKPAAGADSDDPGKTGQVIALDSFRKK